MEDSHVLLCARDPAVIEAVEVAAAALDVSLVVEGDAGRARGLWPAASVRLVSTEVGSRWSSAEPGEAYLIGMSTADLARCSAQLLLPVLPLPDSGQLAEVLLKSRHADGATGLVVALAGASGGLGVTTLVSGLALRAASDGPAVAVDLAGASGGIDLVVGAEQVSGLRWSDLEHARGELGELTLPAVEGASFLAPSRDRFSPPPLAAVRAAVGALARTNTLVMIDAGRERPSVECDQFILVVGADVRSVAAARMSPGRQPTGIIVRTGYGRSLPPDVVARSLGVPLVGVLPEDRRVARLSELGLLPTAPPARTFRRAVSRLLKEVRGG